MAVTIDVEVYGAQEVIAKLEAMELRASNFRAVMWWAQERLEAANAQNFTSGGLPVGGWAPRRDAEPWPLMVRTGALAGSLTSLTGEPNEIRRDGAVFGTAVEYARFHQSGTAKMPARKIVFEPVGFANDLGEQCVDWIVARGMFAS